ncbi:hypothetical protein BaRGS_00013718 [Batillaria attramentaria]|uniref:Glutamate receptor n=1 Tax=Batillaria attramentaria TaxID=370345 RepID=A0ABD0L721_9CAEN
MQPLVDDVYISANTEPRAQGVALALLVGQYNMPHTYILVEDSLLADGFLVGFSSVGVSLQQHAMFTKSTVRADMSDEDIQHVLEDLAVTGWKILVLHCRPHLMARIVTTSVSMSLFGTGYGWFLSQTSMTRDPDVLRTLPEGLLGLQSFYLNQTRGVLEAASLTIGCAYQCMQECYPCVRHSSMCRTPSTGSRYFPSANSTSNNTTTTNTTLVTQQGGAFHLLNLVNSGATNRMWESVGYIAASGQTDLKTVMWPGHTIFGPSTDSVKTYKVVTRPAKPFVFIEGPVLSVEDCFVAVPCLELRNSSPHHVNAAVDDFVSRKKRSNVDYQIYCCKGISLEILGKLAEDLNFQYVIYFVNDTDYGTYSKNKWTGMVGDVVSGAADIIAGAFSMTSSRMNAISFTEPYYQNEFSLVTGEDGRSPSMWAFLSPFSIHVWVCILLSSIVAGVATSLLEWLSPFGLNPRGRNRQKQYSLGSGLLMVWVLVTGHTINVKAPKGWPAKVIQNVWAGLAIFIMTSYTANLAAYLAGQSAVISVKSIYDSKLLHKRVSLIKSSAVEAFLSKVNPDLYRVARNNDVSSTEEAILRLQAKQTDVYLDDTPLLEFAVSRMDNNCKVRFVGKGFGSDGYAFGLPRRSWLMVPMSNYILWYTESGVIQDISKKYMLRPLCEYFLSGSAVQYGLEHTGGLFIILLSAMFVSIFFLFLEHLAYRFLVPWLRSKPEGSFWKTENFAFISQRVHRVVRSEKLYSQKQAAQEMIKIVKQRDFTRLIQKNELQKRKIPPQKRVKTKAEMFQEITANIVSYHRQLKGPESADSDDQGDTDGVVAYDVVQAANGLTVQTPTTPLSENHIGLFNSAYLHDDEHADSVIDESNSRSEITDEDDDIVEEEDENGDDENEGSDKVDNSRQSSLSSPSKRNSRSSFSSLWSSSPRRKLSSLSVGGERREKRPSMPVFGASSSEPTSPEGREPMWELPVSSGSKKKEFLSPQRRRVSDVSPMRRVPSTRPVKNNARSRSQDYRDWDYFQRNLKLKDNRVKSTLRRHALSGYQSQLPADYLDDCTLEALSKEDLLILWKKSELELQTKLNDILGRNKRLALAIDYLTSQENEDGSVEV